MEQLRAAVSREELMRLTKVKLQILCRQLEVPIKGNKKDVVERLLLRQAQEGPTSRLSFFLEELAAAQSSGALGDGAFASQGPSSSRRRPLTSSAVCSNGNNSQTPGIAASAYAQRSRLAEGGALYGQAFPHPQQQPHPLYRHQALTPVGAGFAPSPSSAAGRGQTAEGFSGAVPRGGLPPTTSSASAGMAIRGGETAAACASVGARTRSAHGVARNAMAASQPPSRCPFLEKCYCGGRPPSSLQQTEGLETVVCKICGFTFHAVCYGVAAQKEFVCANCHLEEMDPFAPVVETLFFTRLDQKDYVFELDASDLKKWRNEGRDVYVRCFEASTKMHIQTWPHSCVIKINGRAEETVQAPTWEHKRRDTPIQITQYLRSGENKIQFSWEKEPNTVKPSTFFMAVVLCGVETVESLQAFVGEKSRVGEEESRKRVARIVKASQEEAGDSEVLCLEVGRRLKLLCPVTFVKIETPSRGRGCAHLQCYDLEGYVSVNRQTKAFNSRWRCPQCHLHVLPRDLVVDSFFHKILKETNSEDQEVELQADLTFRVIPEEELKALSKRAETQRLQAEALLHPQGHSSESVGASQTATHVAAVEDVVIDSDDEEEDQDAGPKAEPAAQATVREAATGKGTRDPTGGNAPSSRGLGEAAFSSSNPRPEGPSGGSELFGAEDENYEAEASDPGDAPDFEAQGLVPAKRRRLLGAAGEKEMGTDEGGGGTSGQEQKTRVREAALQEAEKTQQRGRRGNAPERHFSPSQAGYSSGQDVLVILSDDDEEEEETVGTPVSAETLRIPPADASSAPPPTTASEQQPHQQQATSSGVDSQGVPPEASPSSPQQSTPLASATQQPHQVATSSSASNSSPTRVRNSPEFYSPQSVPAPSASPQREDSQTSNEPNKEALPADGAKVASSEGAASTVQVISLSDSDDEDDDEDIAAAAERTPSALPSPHEEGDWNGVGENTPRREEAEAPPRGEGGGGAPDNSSEVSREEERPGPDADSLRAIIDERAGIPPLDDPSYQVGSRGTPRGKNQRSFCSSTNVPAPIPRHCPNYNQRLLAASMPRSAFLFHCQSAMRAAAAAPQPHPGTAPPSGIQGPPPHLAADAAPSVASAASVVSASGGGSSQQSQCVVGEVQLGRRVRAPLLFGAPSDAQRKAQELQHHLFLRNHQVLLHQQRLLQAAQLQQQHQHFQQTQGALRGNPSNSGALSSERAQHPTTTGATASEAAANLAGVPPSAHGLAAHPAVYAALRMQLQSQAEREHQQQLHLLNQQRQMAMPHHQPPPLHTSISPSSSHPTGSQTQRPSSSAPHGEL